LQSNIDFIPFVYEIGYFLSKFVRHENERNCEIYCRLIH